MRGLAIVLVAGLLVACGGGAEERGPGSAADSARGDLALPPSGGAPRASTQGHAPDTVRPEGLDLPDTTGAGFAAESNRHLSSEELDVDSIAAVYRDHYRSEYLDRHEVRAGDLDLQLDPEVVAAAERRTALQFGYVDLDGWEQLLADMIEPQRLELARRIDAFHRELGGS